MRGDYERALTHLELSLRTDNDNLKARNLKAAVLRKRDRSDQAREVAAQTRRLDPLDLFARNESRLTKSAAGDEDFFSGLRADSQLYLDVALDYAQAGFWHDADELLAVYLSRFGAAGAGPMLWYARAHFARCLSRPQEETDRLRDCARAASPDYCFPSRLEELLLLKAALERDPADARAHYYLGNLFYDKQRREDAIYEWKHAARLEPSLPIPWRNLGIAYFNVRGERGRAVQSYQRARLADPSDARLLYEYDQLKKRNGVFLKSGSPNLKRIADWWNSATTSPSNLSLSTTGSANMSERCRFCRIADFTPGRAARVLFPTNILWRTFGSGCWRSTTTTRHGLSITSEQGASIRRTWAKANTS